LRDPEHEKRRKKPCLDNRWYEGSSHKNMLSYSFGGVRLCYNIAPLVFNSQIIFVTGYKLFSIKIEILLLQKPSMHRSDIFVIWYLQKE